MNTLHEGRYQYGPVTLYILSHHSTTVLRDIVYTVTPLYHSTVVGLGLMNTSDKGKHRHGLVTLYILSHRSTTLLRVDWVS